MDSKRIIFIVGPTAVGKTDVAFHLAKKIDSEIISCDAMQVYLGIDIATNKPPASVRKEIPHHLLDIVEIEQNFDVANYRTLAEQAINEIFARKKTPLVVGGSGLYMKILLDGIFADGARDEELRRSLIEEAGRDGNGVLYQKLKNIDPAAASKIHPNDTKRLIRALEVGLLNREPISVLQKKRSGLWGMYDIRIFALTRERKALYQTIDERVEQMFTDGVVEEIESLQDRRWSETAARIIGVPEILAYLRKETPLDKAKDSIKMHTRRYAKRQLTWFRAEKRLQWIELSDDEPLEKAATRILKEIEHS